MELANLCIENGLVLPTPAAAAAAAAAEFLKLRSVGDKVNESLNLVDSVGGDLECRLELPPTMESMEKPSLDLDTDWLLDWLLDATAAAAAAAATAAAAL